jgi:hypothetical protein
VADTIVDAPPGYTKGGLKIGSIVDAPPGYPTATPPPKPGKSPLQALGDTIGGLARNANAARTAAARDPGGALAAVGGAAQGAVAGAAMAPMTGEDKYGEQHPNDLSWPAISSSLAASGRGAWRGATDPAQRDRYNAAFLDLMLGPGSKNPGMLERIGRGAGSFVLQTATDPVTHGGGAAAEALLGVAKPVLGAALHGVAPLGQYVRDVQDVLRDPRLAPAVAKVAHGLSTLTAPIRGGVNAGKDLLFLNPLPHGLGNMTILDWLRNGLGTTAKGLKYGVTGAPSKTAAELQRIGAGAYTPEMMGAPSPWGPVGWMDAIRRSNKGGLASVANLAARTGVGGAAGGAIANRTAPESDTPQQRLVRTLEGAGLGAVTGASPELRQASNKLMSRLETGHRAAMLEDLPKPPPAPKPHFSAADVAARAKRRTPPPVHGPATINSNAHAISPHASGRVTHWPTAGFPEPKPDPRAAEINRAFGGGLLSGPAKLASAAGGPFPGWQLDVIPRAVGGALLRHPARVEAFARAQDITNRDVLAGKPYKLQTGGPVGAFSEMMFNTPQYASRLLGPLGGIDASSATKPQTFSLGSLTDPRTPVGGAVYRGTPGREIIGPALGDTLYPSKAPAGPSAALNALLGWHFANKTPRQDAILSIMRQGNLDAVQAGRLYDRYKR